ncbi:MAG: hypothetical protein KBT04_04215, partial [Bacteroidales bacterium]|nr:hypothetical protein [Candidatus Colimorpha onthohippi]
MKRLFAIIAMVSAMLAVSANSVHYFTAAQANRVVRYLNQQNELMIYCGYEDELESYILVNEVWSERVNSRYFEVWLFGYDAYTGEEVFMPIDLDCIWLLRN